MTASHVLQHRGDSSLNPSIYTQYRSGERLALGIAMSRPLRIHVPGLLHHVFAHGNDKACIYADDQDASLRRFRDALNRLGINAMVKRGALLETTPARRTLQTAASTANRCFASSTRRWKRR